VVITIGDMAQGAVDGRGSDKRDGQRERTVCYQQ